MHDVDYYDISKRIIKEDDNDDYKIDKPGFMSYNPRFDWQKHEIRK